MTKDQADRLIKAVADLTEELRRHRASPAPAAPPVPYWRLWPDYFHPTRPSPYDVRCGTETKDITQEQARSIATVIANKAVLND